MAYPLTANVPSDTTDMKIRHVSKLVTTCMTSDVYPLQKKKNIKKHLQYKSLLY